jgi:hypothetical protein
MVEGRIPRLEPWGVSIYGFLAPGSSACLFPGETPGSLRETCQDESSIRWSILFEGEVGAAPRQKAESVGTWVIPQLRTSKDPAFAYKLCALFHSAFSKKWAKPLHFAAPGLSLFSLSFAKTLFLVDYSADIAGRPLYPGQVPQR